MFSIVTPVFRPNPRHLQSTIDSVVDQAWRDWEWVLVDDASKDPDVTRVLRSAEARDSRIKVVERQENGHIVAASNDGIAKALGQWIVLLDHDDLLVRSSLEHLAAAIEDNPTAGYVYSDEDKIDSDEKLSGEFQKPDWSPERLRHQMYLGHLSAMRSDLVRRAGGFRPGFDGSQDHDLALRVTELCEEVIHIPEILYHWRIVPGSTSGDPSAKGYATESGIRAIQDHLSRLGRPNDKVSSPRLPHTYSIDRQFDDDVLVSVVIPTRGGSGIVWGEERCFVTEAIRSVLSHTEHHLLEFVVVYDSDTPGEVLRELREICGSRLVLKEYSAPFNFSDKCNEGFIAASGDIVILLNDDIEVRSDRFVENLCAPLWEESVGMTGARLTFADDTIQHAGLIFQEAEFQHAYSGIPNSSTGYFSELDFDREVSGLTGACVALRREVFERVGGLYLGLPNNFNDVDFSYKVRSLGLRLVWLSEVWATHFESKSRVTKVTRPEIKTVTDRWGKPRSDRYMPMEGARLMKPVKLAKKARAGDTARQS